MATGLIPSDVVYPESDGKPMAETDIHRKLLVDVTERLIQRYARDHNTYVSGNLLVYFEEGNPYRVLAPDCFVVFGVPARDRPIYKVWEENGKYPDVVIEFTSRTTEREDMTTKFETYQDVWRVREYFLFDPEEDYLDPSLLGYRRSRGELRPIKMVKGRLTSTTLGVTLERDGTRLVLRDAKTRAKLLLPAEAAARLERRRRKAAEAKLAATETKLSASEADNERLRAELEALRKRKS